MNQFKKFLFIFASACLLLILVPSVSYAYTTTSLVYDITGSNPNGYTCSDSSVVISNQTWDNLRLMNLNNTWEVCSSLKVGYKIDSSSLNPILNVNYVLSVYDGTKWTDTNAVVNINQKNVEYIFEPGFVEPIIIKAAVVHPVSYPGSSYSWSSSSAIYSITRGFPDQAAFVDDFDLEIMGNVEQGTRGYTYDRIIHFYDTSILKISNNYYLKGKYWAEGTSHVRTRTEAGIMYYTKEYQSSNVEIFFNGKSKGRFDMSGTPENDSSYQSAILQNRWYFPEGNSLLIQLGSTTPTTLQFQVKHSGSGGGFNISETTIDKNINVNINNFPLINSITSPTSNKIFSEEDTILAPVISVSDVDNQNLTCKYFVDNETAPRDTKTVTNSSAQKTVSFAGFNAGALSDGIHSIRFEIYDGKNTTKMSRCIKVDRRAPIINKLVIDSTTSSITVKGLAADTVCSSDSLVYNINIASSANSGTNSAYTSSNVYTKSGLLPNTKYYISVKVRDTYGHTSSYEGVFYTKK